MDTLLLILLLIILCFAVRELVRIRRQVASIRQFLEWFGVGLAENSKASMGESARQYLEETKQDLIREGNFDPQLAREIFSKSGTPENE